MARPRALQVAKGDATPESPQAKALRARLAGDTLTPEDERRIGHTTAVLEGRAAGKSIKTIAAEIGEARTSLAQFIRGGIYKVIAEHLSALEVSEDEEVAEASVKRTRTALKSMSPHIREYVAWASRKAPGGQGYEDDGAAQWAAQYLAKANGIDAPESASRPSINIHIETIQAVTGDIKRDLAAAARTAGATIDVVAEAVQDALSMDNGA